MEVEFNKKAATQTDTQGMCGVCKKPVIAKPHKCVPPPRRIWTTVGL